MPVFVKGMKKLSLIIAMLISAGMIVNTYADDDLAELEAELEALDSGSTTGDETSTEEDSTITGDETSTEEDSTITGDETSMEEDTSDSDFEALEDLETLENESTSEDTQIVLSTTGETTIDTVNLTFEKLDAYSEYKVYYSKASEDDLSEKQVSTEDDEETIEVTVSALEENTEYQFIVKAFDNSGNPIASTESDPLNVTTNEAHKAPEDNIIYSPVVNVDGSKINISYEPGVDVEKVQISVSEDGQTFKPETTIDASETSYTFKPENTGKTYIKIVPVAEDGTLGVCKVGETEVDDNTFTANVEPKEETQEKMGEPETGPTTYFLIILAVLAYIVYSYRTKRA